MNIVDLVKNQLGGDMVGRIGGMLGVGQHEARSAVDAGIPALLAGLTGVAGTPEGARKLNSVLDGVDDRLVGDLSGALSSTGANAITSSGSNMLGSLLGNNTLGGVSNALSKFTGISASTINSLLALLAPLVLGVLKGQRSKLGLDAGGLANLLLGQKSNIAASMPAGLGNVLSGIPGLSALTGAGEAVRSGAASVQRTASNVGAAANRAAVTTGSSAAKWAIPLVAVLGLIALVWWMANRNPTVTPPSAGAGNAPRNTAPVTPRSSTTTPPAVVGDRPPESSQSVSAQVTRLTGDLNSWFTDTTTALTGITDAETAKTALPNLEAMADKLQGMGSSIGTLPAEARGTLATLVSEKWSALQNTIQKVMNLPGVEPVLQPVMDRVRDAIMAVRP